MTNVDLSCCDFSFPKLSHKASLAVIEDLGFSAVDVGVLPGSAHTTPAAVNDNPRAAADRVLGWLEFTRLVVADVFAEMSDSFEELAVNHPRVEVRQQSWLDFQRLLEFSHRIRSPGLTVLPGVAFPGVDDKQSLTLAATELQRRAEIAGEKGVTLSIEPHYGSIVSTPAAALELLSQAPDVGLTLDYSHFVFQGITQSEVDVLLPRSRHLHLRPAASGDMQMRTGEGAIDFSEMVRRLTQARYSGYLSVEFCWSDWMGLNRVDCVSETAVLRDLVSRELDVHQRPKPSA
jgi:sugar phosphate isomerase/epimerase